MRLIDGRKFQDLRGFVGAVAIYSWMKNMKTNETKTKATLGDKTYELSQDEFHRLLECFLDGKKYESKPE